MTAIASVPRDLPTQVELVLPGRQPLPPRSSGNSASVLSCADPRCLISREPRQEEYAICAAVAPGDVFAVRTWGRQLTLRPRF